MKQKKRGSGKWERISWDEAYEIIAKKILAIKEKHGNTLPIALNKYSGNFNVLAYGIEGMMSSIGATPQERQEPLAGRLELTRKPLISERLLTLIRK